MGFPGASIFHIIAKPVVIAGGDSDGLSLELNGTDESLGTSSAIALGIANSVTLSAWFKAENINDGFVVDWASTAFGGSERFGLSLLNGDITATTQGSNPFFLSQAIAEDSATEGVWTHAALVKDGTSSLRLYLDGQEAAVDTSDVPVTSDVLRVGRLGRNAANFGSFFNGRVGHVIMWDTVLSADEIAEVESRAHSFDPQTNVGNYISASSVKHWWKPGANSDSLGEDFVGSATLDDEENITRAENIVEDAP